MKKAKLLSGALAMVGIMMISIALTLQSEETLDTTSQKVTYHEIDIKSVAASTNMLIQKENTEKTPSLTLKEVKMETVPASIIVPPRVEVYEGLTLEEVAAKIDRNLGYGYMAGKGTLIAKTALDSGVDPFIAAAIILHETGCSANCSRLVITCNNVGGQKGYPGCNGGAYKVFASLDEGIIGFVANLKRNYYDYGLTTIDAIAPKYAESAEWPGMIHYYVNRLKSS